MIWLTNRQVEEICKQMQDMNAKMTEQLFRVAKGTIADELKNRPEDRILMLLHFAEDLKMIHELAWIFRRADRDHEMTVEINHLESMINAFLVYSLRLFRTNTDDGLIADTLYEATSVLNTINQHVLYEIRPKAFSMNEEPDSKTEPESETESETETETKQEENNDVRDEGME